MFVYFTILKIAMIALLQGFCHFVFAKHTPRCQIKLKCIKFVKILEGGLRTEKTKNYDTNALRIAYCDGGTCFSVLSKLIPGAAADLCESGVGNFDRNFCLKTHFKHFFSAFFDKL